LFHDEDKYVDLAEEILGEVANRQEKDNLTAEALMKSLSDKIADSPRDLPTSHDIGKRLEETNGLVSSVKRIIAENEIHALQKEPIMSMAEHIRRFNSLRVEVDFHRPVGVARKSNVDINLIFLGTLDEELEQPLSTIYSLGDSSSWC